tara:strand:- start:10694 stop:11296 length:603 start_codon:yes stop_codon:yes gene_type:complete
MNLLNKYVVVLALIAMSPALSFGQQYTAVETVEIGVKELLTTVQESRELFLTDRESYFGTIEEVLSSIVDFNAVAEVVMNRYAASASDVQKDRFAEILRQTLTRFYGASLVAYEGQELAFLPSRNADADPRADTVVGMELRGGDSNLRLQYQMFINENDEWKLKNISLAGINLGRQYFTQFSALMAQNDNDIDAVLDSWK